MAPQLSDHPKVCTNLKLRQLMRRVTQHYDREIGRAGLKTTQYSLLSYIENMGPIRPIDLANKIKMEPSTLTRNLKPLLDAGWVSLDAGQDARSRLITMSETGMKKRAEARRYWRKAQSELNQLLGIETVLALHALIDQSMEKLERPKQPRRHSQTVGAHGKICRSGRRRQLCE